MEDNKDTEAKKEVQEENTVETQKIQEELDNTTDRLKRLMAEFDNFKKRNAKEREVLYGSILGDIACKLLPVLDNLEKAASADTEDEKVVSVTLPSSTRSISHCGNST